MKYIVALTKPRGILFAASKPDPITDGLSVNAWRAAVTDSQLLRGDGAPVVDDPVSIPPVHEAQSDDPAFIVFTSGTTGRPKGIVHAHRWLDALGDSNRTRIPPQANDVALATGEWSFISALGHNVLFPLRNGVTGSIMDERASPERILATIARDRVTLLYSVATLYRRILSQPGIEERFDVSSLRGVNATGEPLEAAVREEWERRFKCPIWEHFGVSEAQMVLGHAPGVPERPGTVGVSWGARPEILNEDFTPQPPGYSGQIGLSWDYPGFFLEYLGDKQQTDATKRDGWFLTNDLATMDSDGYVSIFGRADDCFKSKGVLIVPRELEDALLQLGIVEEACVFGIFDKEIGNQIGAAIVLRAGIASPPLGRQGVADALQGKIAHFKLPHEVFFFRELPDRERKNSEKRGRPAGARFTRVNLAYSKPPLTSTAAPRGSSEWPTTRHCRAFRSMSGAEALAPEMRLHSSDRSTRSGNRAGTMAGRRRRCWLTMRTVSHCRRRPRYRRSRMGEPLRQTQGGSTFATIAARRTDL